MEKELRKRQILLAEAGIGVMLFAVWSVVKVYLYLVLSPPIPIDKVYEVATEAGISGKLFAGFLFAILAAVLLWQLSIRVYIGLSAVAEGKGKSKGYAYLVWTVVLLVANFRTTWDAFGIDSLLSGEDISANTIINLCMEMVSAYVLLELLISGIRVKRMRKKMKE